MTLHRLTRRAALAATGALAAGPTLAMSHGAEAMELTDAQREYARQSLEISRFLLETSRVVMDKTDDEEVLEFARLEVAENEAFRSVLESTGVEEPPLEPQHENPLQALREAGDGGMSPALMYINTQILAHGSALKTNQAMAKQEPLDMIVATAKMAVPAIDTHLVMLEDMKIRILDT